MGDKVGRMKLSEEFAIVDPSDTIFEYHSLFGTIGTKLVTRPVHESIFVSRAFWLVTHNYLLKVFTTFLAQLHEIAINMKFQRVSF